MRGGGVRDVLPQPPISSPSGSCGAGCWGLALWKARGQREGHYSRSQDNPNKFLGKGDEELEPTHAQPSFTGANVRGSDRSCQ